MRMYIELLQELGLSKNESQIYEALLRGGELSVGQISVNSKVHRRNVYDALRRLIDKGLAFEILERSENRYQAVEPVKLMELVKEKEERVRLALPGLEEMYASVPQEQAVYMYRGLEGWKNYMRDIIRLGEDFYCIGGKGGWMDESTRNFFPQFINDAERKGIKFFHLFDHEVKKSEHEIIRYVGDQYKFLPQKYSTPASIDIFGDRVNIVSSIHLGGIDEDISFTVVVNAAIANAFRSWFQLMWDLCPE